MIRTVKLFAAGLFWAGLSPAWGAVVYVHTDALGSVVLETNQAGGIVSEMDYRAFGEDVPTGGQDGPAFTGHYRDQATELIYMDQRYYDPHAGRFVSIDPFLPSTTDGSNFSRYAYANNNPYRYIDPTGEVGVCAAPGVNAACAEVAVAAANAVMAAGVVIAATPLVTAVANAIGDAVTGNESDAPSDGGSGAGDATDKEKAAGNTNPYAGPVDTPVNVVDPAGNVVPVGEGEQIEGKRNGDYEQVKDRNGEPTGVRIDRGGHKDSSDPKARRPHGHVPGMKDATGNPHLPIYTKP